MASDFIIWKIFLFYFYFQKNVSEVARVQAVLSWLFLFLTWCIADGVFRIVLVHLVILRRLILASLQA